MSITINIQPKILKFSIDEREMWREKYGDTYGFGEHLAGKHLENQGYSYIQHDFNILGGNKLGKYPKSEEIIYKYLGNEGFKSARKLFDTLYPFRDTGRHPFEEPDLLVYKPDLSEIRFVEVKRLDTRDKLRKGQVKGLVLLSTFLKLPVDVYIAVPEGTEYDNSPITFTFD